MGVPELIVQLLGLVASAAPGVLAALSGKASDAEAIEAARAQVQALHPVRVSELANRRRAELAQEGASAPIPAPPVLASSLATLRKLTASNALAHEERAAIRDAIVALEPPATP